MPLDADTKDQLHGLPKGTKHTRKFRSCPSQATGKQAFGGHQVPSVDHSTGHPSGHTVCGPKITNLIHLAVGFGVGSA